MLSYFQIYPLAVFLFPLQHIFIFSFVVPIYLPASRQLSNILTIFPFTSCCNILFFLFDIIALFIDSISFFLPFNFSLIIFLVSSLWDFPNWGFRRIISVLFFKLSEIFFFVSSLCLPLVPPSL